MANEQNNVFSDIQRDIQYEHLINEARSFLASGNFEKAVSTAEEARNYLKPGASSVDIDAIRAAAQSSTEQIERDRIEQQVREEAERQRLKEAERLAREQAEEAERQKNREEQQAQEAAATKAAGRQKYLHKLSMIAFWLFVGIVVAKIAVFSDYWVGVAEYQLVSVLLIPIIWSYYSGAQKSSSKAPVLLGLLMFAGYMYLYGRVGLSMGSPISLVMSLIANTLGFDGLFPIKCAALGGLVAGAASWAAREIGKSSKKAKTGVFSAVVITLLLLAPIVMASSNIFFYYFGYMF